MWGDWEIASEILEGSILEIGLAEDVRMFSFQYKTAKN